MPNVPNLPGVPPLASYGVGVVALASTDAANVLRAFLPPAWGIYIDGLPIVAPSLALASVAPTLATASTVAALFGAPNIVPVIASTVEFFYSADSPISTYPQEEGAFQSYDKVQMPFEIRMKIACSGSISQRQSFQNTLEGLRSSTRLVSVLTPDRVYLNCNCKHVEFPRRADRGVQLIVADVWFEQVRFTSTADFTQTREPGSSGPQSIGNVQPQGIPRSVQQTLSVTGTVF